MRQQLRAAWTRARDTASDALIVIGLGLAAAGVEWGHPGLIVFGTGLIVFMFIADDGQPQAGAEPKRRNPSGVSH